MKISEMPTAVYISCEQAESSSHNHVSNQEAQEGILAALPRRAATPL